MAEEINIDPNLDDEINQEDLPIDNLLGEEEEAPSTKKTSPNILNKIKDIFQNILSNRRYLAIAVGVLITLIITSTFFIFRGNDDVSTTPENIQQGSQTLDTSSITKKKTKKKKKKKIKYVDLYRQLEGRQLTPILRELNYINISYNVIQNGKQFDLQVDKNQIDEAKQILAIKGLPSSTVKGYEIFDSASNLGVTEFDKRIRLIRALSGEMEKAIMEFDVIDFAFVEIVIPETKLFAVTQPPVTSSILLKRKNGTNINDETVYAIMQLVSSSVENLLPENISVVDTEGRLLSTGVLNRMKKTLIAFEEQAEKKRTLQKSFGKGQMLIPEIEDVVDWFQIKFNYESLLEKKAINQLNGVLPIGSYKAAVTIDLNSSTKTGAPDIKRIVTSIVVDEQFDEVELNTKTRNEILAAVAGAIGFIDGRDTIHISKASFLPKRQKIMPKDKADTEILLPKVTFLSQIKRYFRLWPIFIIGCTITASLIIIYQMFKYLIGIIRPSDLTKSTHPKEEIKKIETVSEPPPETMKPIQENDIINELKTKPDFSKVVKLKAISIENSEIIVDEIKQLIQV